MAPGSGTHPPRPTSIRLPCVLTFGVLRHWRKFLLVTDDAALMLAAYAKSERSDLTPADRKAIRALLKEIAP